MTRAEHIRSNIWLFEGSCVWTVFGRGWSKVYWHQAKGEVWGASGAGPQRILLLIFICLLFMENFNLFDDCSPFSLLPFIKTIKSVLGDYWMNYKIQSVPDLSECRGSAGLFLWCQVSTSAYMLSAWFPSPFLQLGVENLRLDEEMLGVSLLPSWRRKRRKRKRRGRRRGGRRRTWQDILPTSFTHCRPPLCEEESLSTIISIHGCDPYESSSVLTEWFIL